MFLRCVKFLGWRFHHGVLRHYKALRGLFLCDIVFYLILLYYLFFCLRIFKRFTRINALYINLNLFYRFFGSYFLILRDFTNGFFCVDFIFLRHILTLIRLIILYIALFKLFLLILALFSPERLIILFPIRMFLINPAHVLLLIIGLCSIVRLILLQFLWRFIALVLGGLLLIVAISLQVACRTHGFCNILHFRDQL